MDPHIIGSIPPFASLPSDEIEYLARSLSPRAIPEQTLLLQEGGMGDRMYILLEGQVEIIKALGTDSERLLAVEGAGSVIGEMSLFSGHGRHTASVRARTPLRVLEISRAEFDALLSRQPALAQAMARTLSGRLDESENQTIRDLLEKNLQLRQAYDELKAAQAQLIEKERMEAELDVARSIQRSILPRTRPRLPGFDVGVLMEPMRSVGGDLYDFIPLDGNRLGIVVGDVSGHGVPAAIFMALAYSLLHAEARRASSPGEALRNLNDHLLGMNDSSMFVTMLYGILNSDTREFEYARAGHEFPVLLNAQGEVAELPSGSGQMLGLFPNPRLDEQSVILLPGSLLLLYTDGVNEAMDRVGRQFGLDGLLAVLRASRPTRSPAQDACNAAFAAVRAHANAEAQQDDVLLVAVQAE
jgi:serine phosphatase RsbU (regulator of sigma subunit)